MGPPATLYVPSLLETSYLMLLERKIVVCPSSGGIKSFGGVKLCCSKSIPEPVSETIGAFERISEAIATAISFSVFPGT